MSVRRCRPERPHTSRDELCDATWNIWRVGVNFDGLPSGRDDQIQIFHRDRAEQDVITENQCTDKTRTVFEPHFDGPDIIADVALAVGRGYFPLLHSLQSELQHN